jgi:hypothetical protein
MRSTYSWFDSKTHQMSLFSGFQLRCVTFTKPRNDRPKAQERKCRRQFRKSIGKKAKQYEGKNGFAAFDDAGGIKERLLASDLAIGLASLGSHDRTGEKRRAGAEKGCQQKRRPRRKLRIGQCKAKRNGRVKDHVANDIEIAAKRCRPDMARNGAVQPVNQPVEQDDDESGFILLTRQEWNGEQSDGEAGQRGGVGGYALCSKPDSGAIKRWIYEATEKRIEHRGPNQTDGGGGDSDEDSAAALACAA